MANKREQDDAPVENSALVPERNSEAQRGALDLLNGRSWDKGAEISPLDRLQAAHATTAAPEFSEVHKTLAEQTKLAVHSAPEGSYARLYLQSSDPAVRLALREKLVESARGKDPEQSVQSVTGLRTINLVETMTSLAETLGKNDEESRAQRYDAIRQLYGLRRGERGDEGPAGQALDKLARLGEEPLPSELSSAIIDKEWEHFVLKEESKSLFGAVMEGGKKQAEDACERLDLYNRAQLNEGNDDLAFMSKVAHHSMSLQNKDEMHDVGFDGGGNAKLIKALNDMADFSAKQKYGSGVDAMEFLKHLEKTGLTKFDDSQGHFSPVPGKQLDPEQFWNSRRVPAHSEAIPFDAQEVGAALAAEKSPAVENENDFAVQKGPGAEKKLSGKDLRDAFMSADLNVTISKEGYERQFGKFKIFAYAFKQEAYNKEGDNFFISDAGKSSALDGIDGVKRTGNSLSFKARPVKDGEKWSLHILGPDGNPTAILTDDGKVTRLPSECKCSNGQRVNHKYDTAGVSEIADSNGGKWKREPGSKDEWTVDRGEGPEKMNGHVTVNSDGSFVFEGKDSKGEAIKIEQRLDGKIVETKGDTTIESARAADGSSVRLVMKREGGKSTVEEVAKYDAQGNEVASFKAVPGKENVWQTNDGSTIEGGLSIGADGRFRFTNQIEQKDGKSITQVKDENGTTLSISEPCAPGEKALTWQRAGDSNWWVSSDGRTRLARAEEEGLKDLPKDNLAEQRKSLEALVQERIRDPERQFQFRLHMLEAERRGKQQGLSDKQIAQSFHELGRLLSAPDDKNAPIEKADDRIKIAEQAVRQFARPESIDQGNHKTCNVAVVENLLYTKQPELALKIVADVALTGRFVTSSGKQVEFGREHLKPDFEAASHPTQDGERSYASQIFQLTAVNAYYVGRPYGPDKNLTVRYTQLPDGEPSLSGTGERLELFDKNGKRVGFVPDSNRPNRPVSGPQLGMTAVAEVYRELGGNNMEVFSLTRWSNPYGKSAHNVPAGQEHEHFRSGHKKHKSDSSLLAVDSPERLGKLLEMMQETKKFPIVVGVHGNVPPFGSDKYGDGHSSHVVVIRGIEPGPPAKVIVDNQWGSRKDLKVDLNVLFNSMLNAD